MSRKETKLSFSDRLRRKFGRPPQPLAHRSSSTSSPQISAIPNVPVLPSSDGLSYPVRNEPRTIPVSASGSSPYNLASQTTPLVVPSSQSETRPSYAQASVTMPSVVTPVPKKANTMTWSSVRAALVNGKSASATGLPSMAGLLAEFLGFADDFEAIEDSKEELSNMARQLGEFGEVLKRLEARSDLTSDIRARLKQIDMSIGSQHDVLSQQLNDMKRSAFVEQASAAREVTKSIGKIISRVHGDVLLLHINIVEASREDDVIQKALRPVSIPAVFASQDRGCMSGTRKAILAQLLGWAKDTASTPIFWLSGMAGIGKTAIAQSFCDDLRRHHIFAPSFFCSRRSSVADHQDVMRIVPTLSAMMARRYPDFKSALLTRLSYLGPDQDVFSMLLDEQVRLLLRAPLISSADNPPPIVVFVIDALDELKDARLMGKFLDVIISQAKSLPVKFFLTSRPEDQVRFRFPHRSSRLHNVLRLHEVADDIVKDDINLYLTQKLQTIPRDRMSDFDGSQIPWPTPLQLERLITLAGSLFLYASTVVRYLMDEDPERRLEILLSAQSTIAMASLDETYRFILGTAFAPNRLEPQEKDNRQRCLRTLICACSPLSIHGMAEILGMEVADVRAAFKPLHSIIQVPISSTDAMSTFHVSFQEYLTDAKRCGYEEWFINVPQAHSALASCCIRIMSDLHFNVTHSKSLYLHNAVEEQGASVPRVLSYACEYGVEHLRRSQQLPELVVSLGERLWEKFLYWLEVLSVTGLIHEASRLLMEFLAVIDAQDNFSRPRIRDFLVDGNQFVTRFQDLLWQRAPHVYVSALPFADQDSLVAQTFRPLFTNTIKVGNNLRTTRHQYPILVLRSRINWDYIHSVAFSPDSTLIISAGTDGTIRVWDSKTGKAAREPLKGHSDSVFCVRFSRDGRHIASGSRDQTIRVWNAQTGKEVCKPLEGHTREITSVAFSPDSRRIVSASSDQTIRIWDVKTGKEIGKPSKGHAHSVSCVVFSPDGLHIVTGSHDRTIRILDAGLLQEICEPLKGHTSAVLSIAFSPDSRYIASGSHDNTIRVWDARTAREICKPLEGHTDSVVSVAFSPDGLHIASGSHDYTIRIWDVKTLKEVCEPLESHTRGVTEVAFSPDSKHIVSGSGDGTTRVWAIRTATDLSEIVAEGIRRDIFQSAPFLPDPTQTVSKTRSTTNRASDPNIQTTEVRDLVEDYNDPVMSVAFSPDSMLFVSASSDNVIRVWDAKTATEVCEPLRGHTESIVSLAFSPDSARIVSGSSDKTIRIWDAKSGKEMREPLEGHEAPVNAVVFSPDGKRIASRSRDQTIRVWDVTTGEESCAPLEDPTPTGLSQCIVFSHNSMHIISVSGSQHMTVRVWNINEEKPRPREPLKGYAGSIISIAVSLDCKYIAFGSRDKMIRVWDTETWQEACEPLEGHTSEIEAPTPNDMITCVAFSADSTRIVSGSHGETLRVWDAKTGKKVWEQLINLSYSDGGLSAVAFSPDSAHIASGSQSGNIRVWDARMGKEVCEALTGQTANINSIMWSSDCTRVISWSDDRTIRVWDVDVQAKASATTGSASLSPSFEIESGAGTVTSLADFRASDHWGSSGDGMWGRPWGSTGWVISSSGQRLFWVPNELRSGFYCPRTVRVIGAGPVRVDVTNFVHGEDWTRCYTGPRDF